MINKFHKEQLVLQYGKHKSYNAQYLHIDSPRTSFFY